MSQFIRTLVIASEHDLKSVLYDINEEAFRHGDAHDPHTFSAIARPTNQILANYEDAYELLFSYHYSGYAGTVRFRDLESVSSATIIKIEKQLAVAKRHQKDYIDAHRICNRKAAFTTCPACGSKIATKHMVNRSCCPVCERADLRSDAVLRHIEKLSDIIVEKQDMLIAEQERLAEHAPIKWLVLYSYHC